MAEQELTYEEITAITIKAFGRTSKPAGADVEGQAGCGSRCVSCKPECGSDCKDTITNVASTGGAFAGAIVGAHMN